MSAARLTVAAAAVVLLVVAQGLGPLLAGRLLPSLLDVAVGCAFAGAAVASASRERLFPGVAVGAGAVLWAASGTATLFPEPFADLALRASLIPHALLVATVVTLPTGRMRGLRAVLLLGLALSVAILAGAGLLPIALLLLGVIALAAAARRWRGASSTIQLTLGAALIVVDVAGQTGALPPGAPVVLVDLLLIGTVVAEALLIGDRARLWTATVLPHDSPPGADAFGSRLGELLGDRRLRVAFPRGSGDADDVDVTGRPADVPVDAMTFTSPDGTVLARAYPAMPVDPFLVSSVRGILDRAGDLARLRADQRDRAEELDSSRRLLLRAADDERADLELRLSNTVGVQLDRVLHELESLGDQEQLITRARSVRAEITSVSDTAHVPTGPAELADRLEGLCRASGLRLTCSIDPAFDPPAELMRTVWLTCVEGLVNTGKHAAGSSATVTAQVSEGVAIVTLSDDGPGGAQAEGAGLRGLRDRAADAGAEFWIVDTQQGTQLELRFELPDFPPEHARVLHDVEAASASLPWAP